MENWPTAVTNCLCFCHDNNINCTKTHIISYYYLYEKMKSIAMTFSERNEQKKNKAISEMTMMRNAISCDVTLKIL